MGVTKSDPKRSAANQILLAIEQNDLDSDIGAGDNVRRGVLRRPCDLIAERSAGSLRDRKGLRRRIRRQNVTFNLFAGAGRGRELGQRRAIDFAAFGMQIGEPLRQFGHLRDAARDGDPWHRMPPQIFEHAADEVAHVDQRDVRQRRELLRRAFRIRAGRPDDVRKTGGSIVSVIDLIAAIYFLTQVIFLFVLSGVVERRRLSQKIDFPDRRGK